MTQTWIKETVAMVEVSEFDKQPYEIDESLFFTENEEDQNDIHVAETVTATQTSC